MPLLTTPMANIVNQHISYWMIGLLSFRNEIRDVIMNSIQLFPRWRWIVKKVEHLIRLNTQSVRSLS